MSLQHRDLSKLMKGQSPYCNELVKYLAANREQLSGKTGIQDTAILPHIPTHVTFRMSAQASIQVRSSCTRMRAHACEITI